MTLAPDVPVYLSGCALAHVAGDASLNARLRIALCGYDTEHAMPDTWTAVPWTAEGGYGSQAKTQTNHNRFREVVWFSPGCLTPYDELPLFRGVI